MAINAKIGSLSPGLRRFKVVAEAPALAQLEASCSEWPWSEALWRQSLEFDDCWLCSDRDQHLAAAVFAPAVDDIALLNIFVAPALQRQGLARWLINRLAGEYFSAGFQRCILEVRESNCGARSLYESIGFDTDGLRKNYYQAAQGREDAVLMSLDLNRWYKEAR